MLEIQAAFKIARDDNAGVMTTILSGRCRLLVSSAWDQTCRLE
jgi:hypothetical protein